MDDALTVAIMLAAEAHDGQFDHHGEPAILHPLAVMSRVTGPIARIVAVLHDVVEDTEVTLDYIGDLFGPRVTVAVDALTRRGGESYSDYIERVKTSATAVIVKVADLEENLSRPAIPGSSLEARYRAALDQLGYMAPTH